MQKESLAINPKPLAISQKPLAKISFFGKAYLTFAYCLLPIALLLLPIISFVLASNVCLVNLIVKLKYYNLMTSNRIYISILLNGMIIFLGCLKFEELGKNSKI